MNLNSEKLTMEELDALNQTEQPEMPPEKVVVELPEEELLAMQDTQAATPKLVNQVATAEKIEAKEEARINAENFGTAAGTGLGYFMGKAEQAKAEAAKATENPEEPKTDNVPDDVEDEGHGFTMHM